VGHKEGLGGVGKSEVGDGQAFARRRLIGFDRKKYLQIRSH
jgi:hypothetical protein